MDKNHRADIDRLREILGDSPGAKLLIELEALRTENEALRKCLKDARWRILDTRETLMRESMVGGDRLYGCDEWSTPTVNLQRAADVIDAAMNGAND